MESSPVSLMLFVRWEKEGKMIGGGKREGEMEEEDEKEKRKKRLNLSIQINTYLCILN
jgi:hypothetical protein